MRDRQAPKLKGTMRKVVFALMLALALGCVSPDPHHDLRTPDPVNARPPDPIIATFVWVLYVVAGWLAPKT